MGNHLPLSFKRRRVRKAIFLAYLGVDVFEKSFF